MHLRLCVTALILALLSTGCGGGGSQTTYAVGGAVQGLTGSGLTLQNNAGDDLQVPANGAFSFATPLQSGATYNVTVKTQPINPSQTCVVTDSPGVIRSTAITNVSVTCTINSYAVGGTVTGLSGTGLVLEVNGGSDLPVAGDGTFTFAQTLPTGSAYSVTVKSQPSTPRELCTVSDGSGSVASANVSSIAISCAAVPRFMYVFDPGNQITTYGIDASSGVPLALGLAVTLTGAQQDLVTTPNGKFLYALSASQGSNEVETFAVDSSHGGLTATATSVQSGGSPGTLAINASGSLLFVVNYGDSTIKSYQIDPASGALTYTSTLTVANHIRHRIAITPDSKYLYVLNANINTGQVTALTAYAIDSTSGALTAGSSFTPSNDSWAMTVDPQGRFLYLTITPDSMSTTVQPYSINSGSGALTAIGTGTTLSPAPVGGNFDIPVNGFEITADPSGQYVYVLNNNNYTAANDSVVGLAVNQTTGALSQLGSPVPTGGDPWTLACDPSGSYLYTGNISATGAGTSWSDVSAFAISGSGTANPGEIVTVGQGAQISSGTASSGVSAVAFVE
jgi:6-phosphogluconolactonase (cycloisomerase 2 family)